jgi:membrane-associated phospholipid phosphatase
MSDRPPRRPSPLPRALDDPPGQRFIGGRDLTAWPSLPGRAIVRFALRLRGWLAPHQVLAAILAVGLIVVALLVVAAAGVYDAVTESDGVAGLDQPVLRFAETLRSPLTNTLVGTYTLLGGAVLLPVLVAAAAIGMAVRWWRWTPIVLTAATAAGSLTLTGVGKAVVGRARPPVIDAVPPYELSASFPSGHSLNSAALATVLAYLLLRGEHSIHTRVLTVALAAAFTVGIGLSRVYLGAHWLTDVLVAWALGLAWATVVIIGHRLFLTLRRSTRTNDDAAEPNDNTDRTRE